MKKPEFHPTQRLQKEYERGMRQITGRMLSPRGKEETFDEWVARLAARSREPDIQGASEFLARRMVKWVDARNARTWREAAARSQQSRKLHRLLVAEMRGATGAVVSRIVRENAALISSLPLVAAETLTAEVAKAQQAGARASTIAKMYRARFPELLRSRVHLISRTETAKASAALTEARALDLNLPCYIWTSSEDQRVRKSHANMNGVVVFYAHPPSPEALVGEKSTLGHYHAGGCPNDRCTQIVVLTLEDIRFPVRVYWNGRVSHMTKQQFKQVAVGLESRAA